MTWRIYYGDLSVFTDKDGTPWDAPRQNVQAIAQKDDRVGWRLISGKDFFIYEEAVGGWRETDFIHDHLLRAKTPLVLYGRQMTDEAWFSLFRKITTELGPKQGWLMTEDRRDGRT